LKRALIIGCAKGVWDEVKAAKALTSFDTIYCVKMAGIEWNEGFFWWVTLHPEFMENYKASRTKLGLPNTYKVIGPLEGECGRHSVHPVDRRLTYRWRGMTSSGSSGLFGIKAALDDGHDKVILAGIPMAQQAGHFKRREEWFHCESFKLGWEAAMPHLKNKVKSLSGWTERVLGKPTPEWLGVSEMLPNQTVNQVGLSPLPEMG
jgi:hypothetical protein